jgi:hypothetical protein
LAQNSTVGAVRIPQHIEPKYEIFGLHPVRDRCRLGASRSLTQADALVDISDSGAFPAARSAECDTGSRHVLLLIPVHTG